MTVLADKLVEAFNAKNNDIKSFIWKGEKKRVNKKIVQDEIKLIDATPEQLKTFYQHCKTMLYNKDKKKPGRYPLLDIIKEQRENCNAELYLHYLEEGDTENNYKPIPRFSYFQSLNTFLDNNKEAIPRETWATTPITIVSKTPVEFSKLTIDRVYKACLDSLGIFNKKHLTLNFITSMGLWFTPQELKDLTEKDANGENLNRLDVVKMRLGLDPKIKLHINQSGLSYKEFRSMINLGNKKYSELSKDQLTILRNKVLFRLEEEVRFHITQWETRMKQIEKVAEFKKINLSD
jgi:hypothetical protein